MSEDKKKGGFFKKLFGRKSEEEKKAEEAAERAAKQQLVDEQMAARMAAINAAALKSAREQDEIAAGKSRDEIEAEKIEEEERRKAEEQAQKDVEAAKRLAEEKRQAEEAHQAELARLAEEKRIAEEKAKAEREAAEKAEKERLAKLEAERKAKEAAEKAAREAAEKAEAEARRKEQERLKREKEEEARRAKEEAARRKAEEKALKEAARKKSEEEAAALRAQQEAERKAREEQAAKEAAEREAARIKAEEEEAARLAELKAAQEKAALEKRMAAKEAQRSKDKLDELAPRKGFMDRISDGLKKSTSRMSDNLAAAFTNRKLDDEAIEELEDILVSQDFGITMAAKVTAELAREKFDKNVTDMEIKVTMADVISDILTPLEKPLELTGAKPEIMLFVGVNGSGKTTTLGKIARRYRDQGKKVLIAAGDTFRAAAVEQLTVWGDRADAPVMSGKLGADAAGLVYDAIKRAQDEGFDVLMIDTAGRLQNRTELMDELEKIVRVIKKHDATAPHHSILVLDATVGQNALSQAEAFKQTAGVTGLIMTKLDGTAKGGVLVALSDKYKLPIHAIGIGEKINDLENFSAPVFAAALSGVADALSEAAE